MPAGKDGPRGRTLTLSAGDIYVEGVRCENERTHVADRTSPSRCSEPLPDDDGDFGVVLHVQEQHLTATEREELREVALGGPDTATRTRTVWQASLLAFEELDVGTAHTCADVAALVPGRRAARDAARPGRPGRDGTSECVVPPNGGYRRLENQLYRVEIHEARRGDATYTGRARTAA